MLHSRAETTLDLVTAINRYCLWGTRKVAGRCQLYIMWNETQLTILKV